MKDLIEALQIFQQYANVNRPTHCEHDVLMVVDVAQDAVSDGERIRLDNLGFFWDDESNTWSSFRFGAA